MYALGYLFGWAICLAFLAVVLGLPVAALLWVLRFARRATRPPTTPYDAAYHGALLEIARRNGHRDAYRDCG